MSIIAIICTVTLIVSGIIMLVTILMHSGKGTGISDMLANSLQNSQGSMSVIEKNLTRITVICVIVFVISLILLMIFYPAGTINPQ